jgi:hypothetical protein
MSTERRLARPSHDDKQLGELLHAVANLNDRLGQLQRGIRTLNGAQRLGAGYAPIRAASQVISGSAGRLAGWR